MLLTFGLDKGKSALQQLCPPLGSQGQGQLFPNKDISLPTHAGLSSGVSWKASQGQCLCLRDPPLEGT